MTEDLTVFFSDWGVPATPQSGGAITVIFDRAYLQELGIDATGPTAVCQSADVAARGLAADSTITIGATAYRITGLHPDGTGITVLILEEVLS